MKNIQKAQDLAKINCHVSPPFCSPIIIIDTEDLVKLEENEYQVKVENSSQYMQEKLEFFESSIAIQTNEIEDFIKIEHYDESQVKIEDANPSNSQMDQIYHYYPLPMVKAEELDGDVKIETDEYQIKIENSLQSSTHRSHKNSRRSPLGPNSRHLSCTKNIAMNYGRAIASFARSSLALPYLSPRLEQEGLTQDNFYSFLKDNKINLQSMCGLRSTLLIQDEDDHRTRVCKKIFQWLGEVFIKCFSVNWIMNGKLSHKMVYLKYRFKMLRRIQNPEKFTYIKQRKRKDNN